jgi:hypothetical protein
MSDNKKNKLIIFQTVLLVAIIILNGIYFGPKIVNKIKDFYFSSQYISLNDDISDIEFYDINNTKATFGDGYKFIVYLSPDCSTCITHLPILKKVNETFGKDTNLAFMLMWADKLPDESILDYYGFSECSYFVSDFHAAKSYNTVFLADADNNIIFKDDTGYNGILDNIMELDILNRDDLILNANIYIIENLVKQYDSKTNLIYFSMPGCPDCAEADPIVYDNEITDKFHITRIELVKGAEMHEIKDEYNIFRKIYSIDWYPSFLIINDDNTWGIVRKVELDVMKEKILENFK